MAQTRQVFSEQRDLMDAQIKEAKRSANLFEKQNTILLAQENSRLARERMARFEATLNLIEVGIRTRLVARKPLRFRLNDYDALASVFQDTLEPLPIETKAAIGAATTSAIFKQYTFAHIDHVEVYKRYGHRESFESLCELIDVASEQAAIIGHEALEVLNLLRLPEFQGLLQMYLDNGPGDSPLRLAPPTVARRPKLITRTVSGLPVKE